ncbi:MAG: ABC transporter permease [Micromonosporaceae bacterium]|nr:ABC transporter permease [Micromonosporaceae bacterium]
MYALHMEWTKLRTVATTGWWLLGLVACTVGLAAFVSSTVDAVNCAPRCDFDLPRLSLSGVYIGQIAAVALGALAVTTEYDTAMVRTTLAAYPRRGAVLAAKLAVVTVVVLGCAALGVLGSLAVARGILPGNGFTRANGYPPLSLGDRATLRAYLGTVLYLGLIAILSAGVGATLRNTAATVSMVLGMLYVLPIVIPFLPTGAWRDALYRYSPMSAGLTVQATRGLNALPIGPWPGLGVLAGYAGAAVLAGALLFRLRDA